MPDPYNTITIYRNAGFQLPVSFETLQSFGDDVSTWSLVFVIAPNKGDGTFGTPFLTVVNPILSTDGSGTATFTLSRLQTKLLVVGTAYHYVVMHHAPGDEPTVDVYGRVKLIDAPVMT
jgi:hypothetical protein